MIHRAWKIYALNLAIFAAIFSVWQTQPEPLLAFVCGWVVWAVATFPLILWYRRGHHGLPMFELVCLAYGFAYGVALHLTPNWIVIASHRLDLSWELVEAAALLTALGVVAGVFTFYATVRITIDLGLRNLSLGIPLSVRSTYVGACVVLGMAARIFNTFFGSSDESYGAILAAAALQFYIGLVVLAYDTFERRRPQLPLILLTALATAVGLLGGMMETAVLPLLLVLIVRWHIRNRFPWILAGGLAMFYLAVNPVKYEYRKLTWFGEEQVGAIDRIANWVEAAKTTYLEIKDPTASDEEDSVFEGSLRRIDLLHKLAYVESMTPDTVPFLGGESYQYMLYTLIPRLVWPDKPRANEATDLVDYTYGFRFVGQESHGTNIGAGFVAEAFANFSWIGVIAIIAIQGAIFAILHRLLNSDDNLGGQAIYAAVMMSFLNGIGTSAVVLFGNILQFTIFSIVFLRIFSGSAMLVRGRQLSSPVTKPA